MKAFKWVSALTTAAVSISVGHSLTQTEQNDQSSFTLSPSKRYPSNHNLDLSIPIPPRPPNLSPLYVTVLTRHGHRTPLPKLPGQSIEEFHSIWGYCHTTNGDKILCNRSQLTPLGEHQLFIIGQNLHNQYIEQDKLLPSTFDSEKLLIRSTDVPRTQLSLCRLVQGLYPTISTDTIAKHAVVLDKSKETLYPNEKHCARLRELFIQAFQTEAYLTKVNSKEVISLKQQFESEYNTAIVSWLDIADELRCRQAYNIELPRGITQEMAEQANKLAEWTFYHGLTGGFSSHEQKTEKLELARLSMGRFLFEILNNIQGKVNSENVKVASIYAAHDSTIIPLMEVLGHGHILEGVWPTFASNMIIELCQDKHNNQDKYWIRVIFNNKQIDLVPFDKWKTDILHLIPDDFEKECIAHSKDALPDYRW
ncbi:unnamed protein product [Didymodactylos carnosus]|uniref:2-phosphoxylose phosphatase 1 n=1 Tax=Didymodactylos carnosus TaxID=1234261 RepID=A0A8S2F4S3_9BILA|nr:unnamed protein product [Didymodactylos carnosus]CAF4199592.1 unnamed protein product [Didymodactylos carnosus]